MTALPGPLGRSPARLRLRLARVQGRLVVAGNGRAVVEYPGALRDGLARTAPGRLLDLVDRFWAALVLVVPPATVFALAAAVAVLGQGRAGALLLAVSLVATGLAWVLLLLVAELTGTLVRAYRAVERDVDPRAHVAGFLLGEHWTISLLEAADAETADRLVEAARARVRELAPRARELHHRAGGPDVVLVRLDAVSSPEAEHALRAHPDAVEPRGLRPRLVVLTDRSLPQYPTTPAGYGPRGIFALLGGAAVVLLILPGVLVQQGIGVCAAACGARGPTYPVTLRWLLGQLIPFSGAGFGAGEPAAEGRLLVLGWLVRILGLVLGLAVVVAGASWVRDVRAARAEVGGEIGAAIQGRLPTVAIVTALPVELTAARAVVEDLVTLPGRLSRYEVGWLRSQGGGRHPVVLTCLLDGGIDRAAADVAQLAEVFRSVDLLLMCGIAAGVPTPGDASTHVRLGDVVVSTWGVVAFDHVDQRVGGPVLRTGPTSPSPTLCRAANVLQADQEWDTRRWGPAVARVVATLGARYARPDVTTDVVHDVDGAVVAHPQDRRREQRPGLPVVHHARIGSSERSLRDASVRDALARQHGLSAFEMEGKGIGTASSQAGLEWLVVRGVSDYGDAHATPTWRACAAAAAAAYVAELLAVTPSRQTRDGHPR